MSHQEATTTGLPSEVSIYDRFTNLYDLMFRVNGYGRSVESYLRENPLPLAAGARVLDAGCGTGLLTLAFLRAHRRPADITSIDLSVRSLHTARKAARKLRPAPRRAVTFAQANALQLPFADETFDLVMTSGVLEYRRADSSSSSPSGRRRSRCCSKSCSASRRTRLPRWTSTRAASSASSNTTASPPSSLSAGRSRSSSPKSSDEGAAGSRAQLVTRHLSLVTPLITSRAMVGMTSRSLAKSVVKTTMTRRRPPVSSR
jgi:hypothetical protein